MAYLCAMKKFVLSVLDQAQIRRGATAAETLAESLKLARYCESLGYLRFWLSEHHNFSLVASTAPEILTAFLAAQTSSIRLGTGGIMLPNHSAFKMAENFGTLATLFPNRIDFGIGRAPGGDRLSAHLLNPSNTFSERGYLEQIQSVRHFLRGHGTDMPETEPVFAHPIAPVMPEMWLLSSSGGTAEFAARLGLGLSFAQFINPEGGADTVDFYLHNFKPSDELSTPKVKVSVFAFCSENPDEVSDWVADFQYRMLHIESGAKGALPSLSEIKSMRFTLAQQARMAYNRGRFIAGSPAEVKAAFEKLTERYQTREIMVATPAESWDARKTSYRLMAEM